MLPLDLYVSILEHLPADRFTNSVGTLVNCARASSILREASLVGSLWEPHYLARYLQSEEIHESRRRTESNGNWYLMYAERRRKDKLALEILDQIVARREGRYRHAAALTEMSFDVWDALEIECSLPVPPLFDGNSSDSTRLPGCINPTRRFWASAILNGIAKRFAICQWGRFVSAQTEPLPSFVKAYSYLSCFFGKPPTEIESHILALSAQCRMYFIQRQCSLNPDTPDYDLPRICTTICQFMLDQGFGAVEPLRFHHISNHFPHLYLTTHRKSIPISLVHIFVALARGVAGVQASPVEFPGRVLAHIPSPPGTDDFLVDVYGAETQAILSLRNDIPPMLARMGVSPDALPRFVSPCGAVPMLSRAARNILSSMDDTSRSSAQRETAVFAAICIYLLFTNEVPIAAHMLTHVDIDPLYCTTFLSDLQPFTRGGCKELLQKSCQDVLEAEEQQALLVHPRTGTVHVAHYVGMVFEHRRYPYNGCIIGWDPTCCQSEEWQRSMNVRSLSRGANQPFYHVISLDGNHRYVAEDNIRPITLTRELAVQFLSEVPVLPRYFSDVEESGLGRWRLSPELQHAFPDDDRFASERHGGVPGSWYS